MGKKIQHLLAIGVGLIFILSGIYGVHGVEKLSSTLQVFAYLALGLGCCLVGYGSSRLSQRRILAGTPEVEKEFRINQRDERNQQITFRAKAKAYDAMCFVFAALLITFLMLGVDRLVILLFIIAYVFVLGYGLYHRFQLQQKM